MKDAILNRRSIRKYTNFKISNEELLEIIDLAQRAPSTQNLQSWRFFVVDENAKPKLKLSMPYNLTQLETSSHMILLSVDTKKHDMAEIIFDRAVSKGLMPIEVRDKQLANFKANPPVITSNDYINKLFLDAGLVAMNLSYAAKVHGYDTNIIGGFNHDTVNENLGIDDRYIPVVLISIGKADDKGFESVRLRASETTTFIK